MWVNKAKYEALQAENERLQKDSDTLRGLMKALADTEDGRIYVGEVVMLSSMAWEKISHQLAERSCCDCGLLQAINELKERGQLP